LKGKIIVLNVTFRLRKVDDINGNRVTGLQGDKKTRTGGLKLDYGDIRAELQAMEVTDPAINDVREAVCRIRRRKLPDPAQIGNAGSFFKNPVISKDLMVKIQQNFPEIPFYSPPTDDSTTVGHVKVPAAWLIEQCGWKGYRDGDAGVHANQPLVLVNYGNATGKQVLSLATRVMDSVQEKFGIRLEMEVNVVG
jgi:UDP-N-acetylmuramate dehydrogenase